MDERLDTRSVVRYHLPMKRHLPLFLLPFLSCIPFAHHPSTFEDVAPDAPPAITGPDARHEFQVRVLQPMTASAVLEPGRVRVPRKNTPIPMLDLIKVLHDGHVVVFGYTPSRRRLAGALAQVRAENGNGVKVYNHNLGNIGLAPRMKAPFYHYGAGIFLVFPEFKAGAVAYWQTVQKWVLFKVEHSVGHSKQGGLSMITSPKQTSEICTQGSARSKVRGPCLLLSKGRSRFSSAPTTSIRRTLLSIKSRRWVPTRTLGMCCKAPVHQQHRTVTRTFNSVGLYSASDRISAMFADTSNFTQPKLSTPARGAGCRDDIVWQRSETDNPRTQGWIRSNFTSCASGCRQQSRQHVVTGAESEGY